LTFVWSYTQPLTGEKIICSLGRVSNTVTLLALKDGREKEDNSHHSAPLSTYKIWYSSLTITVVFKDFFYGGREERGNG